MHPVWLCMFLHISTDLCKPKEKRELDFSKRASRSKCCRDIGCFSTAFPFTSKERPLSFLPKCPNDLDIKYTVYSRRNLHVGYDVKPGDVRSLERSDFNNSRPTKVIIHGFIENTEVAKWMTDMKHAFLIRGDFNVILVDWGKGSSPPYTQATANTRAVGAELALLVKFLQTRGAVPETFHIVGHSLGAHIAGYAGERVQYIGRITGMDPADPYFSGTDKIVRLDTSDALFVDVIHTDGDHFLSTLTFDGGFGMAEPIGHADYYPNGGEDQPGCDDSIVTSIVVSGLFDGGKKFVACDHLRVYEFFTESINSQCPYTSFACSSYEDFKNGKCSDCGAGDCTSMGYWADKNIPKTPTSYYLDTGDKFPFCRYHYQINVTIGDDGREEYGKIYAILYGNDDSTDELILTPEDIYIRPGETYVAFLTLRQNVGTLKTVDLRWKRTRVYTRPGHWAIFRTPTLPFKEIAVRSETSDRKAFCTDQKTINSEVRESFKPCP